VGRWDEIAKMRKEVDALKEEKEVEIETEKEI
jgi:hypothetical protein